MNRKYIYIVLIIVVISGIGQYYYSMPLISISPYPNGLNFSFTITDDPDETKLDKLKPAYEYLDRLGLKTTIACWMYKPVDLSGMPDPEEQIVSETLENIRYVEFLKKYQKKGFEIALHTVTAGNDKREITEKGYSKFKELFGNYPEVNIMHSKNLENIYWGKNVFSNTIMKRIVSIYDNREYSGQVPGSSYFWGDICKEKTKYVRLWGTSDINTLKFNPSMPYHDENKPYVNYWFSFSDGYTANYFNKLLSKKNIDKLVSQRGACIAYTHFAANFCHKDKNGVYQLNDTTKNLLDNLANQKQGWFVPVSELLDRLESIKKISISSKGNLLKVTNENVYGVEGITIKAYPFMNYRDATGVIKHANEEGEIVIGMLQPREIRYIYIDKKIRVKKCSISPGIGEYFRMVSERLKIVLFSHRG